MALFVEVLFAGIFFRFTLGIVFVVGFWERVVEKFVDGLQVASVSPFSCPSIVCTEHVSVMCVVSVAHVIRWKRAGFEMSRV